jgi:predicted metal-dependent phosphotriesterase family hydrolase
MSQVPTVRGPVDSAELGPACMHEHIFTRTAGFDHLTELAEAGFAPGPDRSGPLRFFGACS